MDEKHSRATAQCSISPLLQHPATFPADAVFSINGAEFSISTVPESDYTGRALMTRPAATGKFVAAIAVEDWSTSAQISGAPIARRVPAEAIPNTIKNAPRVNLTINAR